MRVVTINSKLLAPAVAKELDVEFLRPSYGTFPDGESYIRFNRRFDGEEILLIQTTYPHQDKRLHEIYCTTRRLKKLGAVRITAVIPYLAYMRQHRDFSEIEGEGYEIISAEIVVANLRNNGIDELYTVDVHSTEVLDKPEYSTFFKGDLDSSSLFVKYFAQKGIKNLIVVAPDDNAKAKAEKVASKLGVNFLSLSKYRDKVTGEPDIKQLSKKLHYENTIIIDDMISTGDTVVVAARELRVSGVKNIFAACTHALMVNDAERKLKGERILEIISTNSIENKFSKISLASLIAKLYTQS